MPVRLGNTRWWLGLQHEHVDGRRRLTGRGCCRVLKTGLRARKEGYDARTQGLDACLGRIRRSSVPPADGERLLRWRESGKGRGGGTWGCKLLGGGYGGAGERAEKSSARRRRDFFGRRYSRGGLLERFVHCAYSALDVLRMACAWYRILEAFAILLVHKSEASVEHADSAFECGSDLYRCRENTEKRNAMEEGRKGGRGGGGKGGRKKKAKREKMCLSIFCSRLG